MTLHADTYSTSKSHSATMAKRQKVAHREDGGKNDMDASDRTSTSQSINEEPSDIAKAILMSSSHMPDLNRIDFIRTKSGKHKLSESYTVPPDFSRLHFV